MGILISRDNPTVDKLLTLTHGDNDAVRAAVAKAANGSAVADLKVVVQHLQQWRRERATGTTFSLTGKDGSAAS